MHAGLGDVFPRQVALLGLLCVALGGLVFYDTLTPAVLNQVVKVRNRTNDFLLQREIHSAEKRIEGVAERLSVGGDPASLAVAAWSLRSIAVRKETPYYAPDQQNEAFYHRPAENASAENARAAALEQTVLEADFDAHALARAADGCRGQAECDNDAAVTRLIRLEPGNAYGWALAYESAFRVRDKAAMATALRGMATSNHYDAYEGRTIARLLSADGGADGADHPEWIDTVATRGTAMGLLGAWSGETVGFHCRTMMGRQAAVAPDADTVAGCRAVFALFAKSTKLGTRILGVRGIFTLSVDPAARATAKAQLRDLYWLGGARFEGDWMTLDSPGPFANDAEAELWAEAFAVGDGEVPSLRRWYAARGLGESAPAGFKMNARIE